MPTIDVLLMSKAPLRHRRDLEASEPPLSRDTEVAAGIRLAGVRSEIASAVFHRCKFRELPPDGEQALYGLVRMDPPGSRWDEDQALSKVLFLSHFVHAHEGGFEFAARIETDERSRLVGISPAAIDTPYARAYPCRGVRRRWLTQSDGEELKQLISAYDSSKDYLRDKNVGMAVSLFADSPFIFHGRPRASLLATVLEGLVSRGTERAFKQFAVRVPAVATEVGLPQFELAWATRIYKLRCKLAHGAQLFPEGEDAERQRRTEEIESAMLDMDELLRRILMKSLMDRAFAERIENAATSWPVPGTGCPTCRGGDSDLQEVHCPRCAAPWR
jgi:hypothetical protein